MARSNCKHRVARDRRTAPSFDLESRKVRPIIERLLMRNGITGSFGMERNYSYENSSQHLIAEVPGRPPRVEMTIGIDFGDVWSHYSTLDQGGNVVG